MADGVFVMGLLDAHSRMPVTHLPSLILDRKTRMSTLPYSVTNHLPLSKATLVAQTEDLEHEN